MSCPLWTRTWTFMQHSKSLDFVHALKRNCTFCTASLHNFGFKGVFLLVARESRKSVDCPLTAYVLLRVLVAFTIILFTIIYIQEAGGVHMLPHSFTSSGRWPHLLDCNFQIFQIWGGKLKLKLRLCIWQQGSLFLILSYPGLFKNIPHVWFLRLYSFLKNPQYDFPKMRGGGSKAVWNFSENSSVLVGGGFPKLHEIAQTHRQCFCVSCTNLHKKHRLCFCVSCTKLDKHTYCVFV